MQATLGLNANTSNFIDCGDKNDRNNGFLLALNYTNIKIKKSTADTGYSI